MYFSKRNNFTLKRTVIQTESLDEQTRNALWNVIGPYLLKYADNSGAYIDLWSNLYEKTSDSTPVSNNVNDDRSTRFYKFFRKEILEGSWFVAFDIIEFLVDEYNTKKWKNRTYSRCNRCSDPVLRAVDFMPVFERYMIGYRFIDNRLVSITSNEEITAIEDAITASEESVAEQLSKAVGFLSNRQTPDYAKSIDCSISAVEAQCRHLLGNQTPTLGKALKLLEDKGIGLHGSLKSAFEKLFGFTSDANGIRHGGLQPSDADADLAKFMLVSCSAFVNYLKSKQA